MFWERNSKVQKQNKIKYHPLTSPTILELLMAKSNIYQLFSYSRNALLHLFSFSLEFLSSTLGKAAVNKSI